MIIGLTGYAEAGKDSVGKILVEKHGFTRVAFADKIRELALALNPGIAESVKQSGWDVAKKNPVVREYLQWLAGVGRKVFGTDFWTSFVATQTFMSALRQDDPRFVVTDIRYPHEAFMVREYMVPRGRGPCFIVGVDRPGHRNAVGLGHSSESSVDFIHRDLTLLNDGSIQDLEPKVDEMMLQLSRAGNL